MKTCVVFYCENNPIKSKLWDYTGGGGGGGGGVGGLWDDLGDRWALG